MHRHVLSWGKFELPAQVSMFPAEVEQSDVLPCRCSSGKVKECLSSGLFIGRFSAFLFFLLVILLFTKATNSSV